MDARPPREFDDLLAEVLRRFMDAPARQVHAEIQRPDGEVVEDPAWRWSAAPDRYLDTALRYELSSAPGLRPVDSGTAQAVAVTLLTWHLESAGGSRLVGAVQLDVTGTDRAIRTQVIRASEAVSAELPGDLAAAAGRPEPRRRFTPGRRLIYIVVLCMLPLCILAPASLGPDLAGD